MTVKVNEIINWVYSNYKDKIVQTHTIQGDTLKEVCGKIYALDRSSRYDNARRYEIVDNDTVKESYIKYKSNVSIIARFYAFVNTFYSKTAFPPFL